MMIKVIWALKGDILLPEMKNSVVIILPYFIKRHFIFRIKRIIII